MLIAMLSSIATVAYFGVQYTSSTKRSEPPRTLEYEMYHDPSYDTYHVTAKPVSRPNRPFYKYFVHPNMPPITCYADMCPVTYRKYEIRSDGPDGLPDVYNADKNIEYGLVDRPRKPADKPWYKSWFNL